MNAPSSVRSTAPAQSSPACYHCGLPLPSGGTFSAVIGGQARAMCCAGCQAVAEAIVAGGLADYYRHRDSLPESPREAIPVALQELGLFDHPEVQKSFVRPVAEHEREAALILEGITCSACIWLNEQHLARQPGVSAVDINYATRRARVRWDARVIRLSDILAAIAAIGYRAHPFDPARSEQLAHKERRAALWRLFVAGFGMMQVMMYAVPVYLAEAGTMTADIEQLMRWASLVLTLPVVFYSSAPFFRNAWRDLRLRRVGMDVPVALGVASAFAASLGATFAGGGEVYYDSVTMFVFLLLCGRYLEMVARQRAVRGVEQVARALPAFASRVGDGGDDRVPVAALVPGDRVLVRPGEAIPADGVVLEGDSSVDESLLTGESRPVPKGCGAPVTGGSVNRANALVVRIERVGDATRLASIQRLMERAQAEKPQVVQTADRMAAGFVAAILLAALATGAFWWHFEPARSLWVFVSVLVVSCPCALSLATPAALTVAVGALVKLGVLPARGHAIETLARATHFVFDKTGTLTEGRLVLEEVVPLGQADVDTARRLAAALEARSEHAIGLALRQGREEAAAEAFRAETGHGVEGRVAGQLLRIGTPEFVAALHGRALAPADRARFDDGRTWVALGGEAGWIALFAFADRLRSGAVQTVAQLRNMGVAVSILSGDAPQAVEAVARRLGISGRGACTPEQKHAHIRALQASGAVVAMVGDGVNDAPVLAQAQVSVAMGGGTDLARAQGDFVLLCEGLAPLAAAVAVARRSLRIIRQNLAWAVIYNLLALPAAMAGWVTPWMAGIGMSASSVLVVANALRLQRAGGARPPAPFVAAEAA